MSCNTIILVTGANRGIGKGLVTAYLAHSNITVVATVRNLSSAEPLHSLLKASGSRLIVIEAEFASMESIKRGIASLTSEHNIDSLDIVIANAGIAAMSPKLLEAGYSEIQPIIDVNAYGQLELFKAVAPLLRNSKNNTKGKFVYISSAGGSLTTMNIIAPLSAYGASKALGNFFFKWLSLEQQDIIVWSQNPGMVATEMAKAAFEEVKLQGLDLASMAISVEQSCQAMLQVISNATLESAHGKFLAHDGEELPW
ncbi:hypothetical protein EKO04_002712 [Ascochyta lentis]|uniref:NAD(P)-binding protein n=1 Tax=Ascochyta lentis TaxID=205686 RepID=A0A8H7J823_9PLEO|nr:hypothetical protein EKO04_002712 [Ascochyta lentis]